VSETTQVEKGDLYVNEANEVALYLEEDELVILEGLLHHAQEIQVMIGGVPTDELYALSEKLQQAIEFIEESY